MTINGIFVSFHFVDVLSVPPPKSPRLISIIYLRFYWFQRVSRPFSFRTRGVDSGLQNTRQSGGAGRVFGMVSDYVALQHFKIRCRPAVCHISFLTQTYSLPYVKPYSCRRTTRRPAQNAVNTPACTRRGSTANPSNTANHACSRSSTKNSRGWKHEDRNNGWTDV